MIKRTVFAPNIQCELIEDKDVSVANTNLVVRIPVLQPIYTTNSKEYELKSNTLIYKDGFAGLMFRFN